MKTRNLSARSGQRGLALITALLLLLVVTIMAVSMFRSYGTQERIAGNTRDKQRATNAAISAQQFAEYWLSTNSVPASATCSGNVPSTTSVLPICNLPLANPTSTSWPSSVTYTQFTSNTINGISNIVTGTGANATGDTATASASYFAAPMFYIADLGANADASNPGEVYQIDSLGYGGTANTVAVVESTYLISPNTVTPPGP